jgi:hypothetical protein
MVAVEKVYFLSKSQASYPSPMKDAILYTTSGG